MKKEVVVFIVTVALLGALWFLSAPEAAAGSGRGGRAIRAADQQVLQAKKSPGRFIAETEVTWAPNGSNIFETPSETRDLPPLDLAPPPLPRLVYPGPPLPLPLSLKARSLLRRTIVPVAAPAGAEGGGGGAAVADAKPADGSGASAAATQPGQPAADGPLIPLDKQLSAVDRAKLTLEQEAERLKAQAAAKQSEEERKKSLDRIVFSNQSVSFGEMVADKGENRYAIKRDLDMLRTDPSLTEIERNDRLKKMTIRFREDKRGKLGKAYQYTGDTVLQVVFADTPETRYRIKLLDTPKTDLAQQLDLARGVFDARLFALAAEHLTAMRGAGLSAPELYVMLADSQHELFDYNHELEVLRQATEVFPDSAPLLARLGRLQWMLGMHEDARASFAVALAKNAGDPLANAGMANILLRAGDAARALPHLREALNLAGADPVKVDGIRLLMTEAYLSLGDFRNAHETVDLVLQRSNVTAPERQRLFARAFALASLAALGQGQIAEARARAEEGAKRYPLSGPLAYLLGIVMVQQGELAAGKSRIQTAYELDPLLTGHAQVALAAVEEASGRDDAAAAVAEAGALTANPAASELRLPFGRALLHVGDFARAREQLLVALEAEPKSPDALVALGDTAYAEGNLPDAIRFYDRAAALEPAFAGLLPRRIIAQVRRRKLADAEELASKVTTAELKDSFLQAALAYFQYTKGNEAEALNTLQKLGDADAGALSQYAKAAHAALVVHENKAMWTDTFSRTGAQLGRDWNREIGAGVNIALSNQSVVFEGTQRGQGVVSDQPTMIWQERQGDRIHAFSADLDLNAQPGVYAGVGIMVMNQTARPTAWPGMPKRSGGAAPYTGLQVALSPESKLVYRVLVKGQMGEWQDVPGSTYTGGAVRVEIRMKDPREGVVEVLVNRESALSQTISDLKRFRRTVELQIFCQAQVDRKVHFSADNVEIVTLKEAK